MKQSFFLDSLRNVTDRAKQGDYEGSVLVLLININYLLYEIAKDQGLIEEDVDDEQPSQE